MALADDGSTSCVIQFFTTHTTHFLDREWALWSSVLESRRFRGRSRRTAANLAAVSRAVVNRFELSTGPSKAFPKATTVLTRDQAANKVAAGKLHDEADGWEGQPASNHHTGWRDDQL